ncbi:hypothetical protein [Aeoliella sp. SH292]|uniref:hypothetical protein n=1 Tax=Aeoliella sp. SH292 TaxID=3454464 RepID=UPI003F9A3F96
MNEEELLRDFVRADSTTDGVAVFVRELWCDGPGTPVHHWTKVETLPTTTSEVTIRATMKALLENERYFRVCPECLERKPDGLMMDSYCQSCGAANHGIVF